MTETPPPAAPTPDEPDKPTEAAEAAATDEPEADRPTDPADTDDATQPDATKSDATKPDAAIDDDEIEADDDTSDADETDTDEDDEDEDSPVVAERSSSAAPAIVGAIVAVVVLALGIWGLTSLGSAEDTPATNNAAPPAAATSAPAAQVPSGPVAALDTSDPATPAAACAWTDAPSEYHKNIGKPPKGEPRKGTGTMVVETTLGNIEIAMNLARTPCTAWSMKYLSDKKFYNESTCHRLTGLQESIGILQCGDPTASGGGGPTYEYGDENLDAQADQVYERGVVAMANRGPNTNGSQFFINFKDGQLANAYTPFGVVTKGMDIIDHIAARGNNNVPDGPPVQGFSIIKVTVNLG
ncbi:hypothetical protein GCM10009682_31370 [Luedemannella flava]|uniref:PPIase cyclophilin-type domain-containing protein n=1 Tax=Luedemannella flava TaxID=349316 RepID=A0ABN2M2P5_9ACTN